MSWYGKDGKRHETYRDKIVADAAWNEQRREQEQQVKLLEQQNRLINKERIERQQLAEKQMEHDEKMRILSLFDAVGLNKSYYDGFVNYLIGDAIEKLEDLEESAYDILLELEVQEESLKKINSILQGETKIEDAPKDLLDGCYIENEEIKTKKEVFLKYEHGVSSKSLIPQDEKEILGDSTIDVLVKIYTKNKRFNKVFFYTSGIALWIIMYIIANSGFVATITMFVYIFIYAILTEGSSLFKTELEKLESQMMILDKNKVIKNIQKYYDKEIKEYEKKKEIANAGKNRVISEIESKWNDFVEFRKKHYNSQMEKLFLDVGLMDEITYFGLEYPKINTNNKNGDGTVEDYIAYFDEII